jgi:hypothetical protein
MNRKGDLNENEISLLETIIYEILENPYSEAFKEPVNYKELGLVDYPKIVKRPMNINKIMKNLHKSQYTTVRQCLDDIQLVWDNCKLYNVEDSDIYKLAVSLEEETRALVKEYFGSDMKYGQNNPSYKMLIEKENK